MGKLRELMLLMAASRLSKPAPQELPNNIMHPTRSMSFGFSRAWPRAGDGERSKDLIVSLRDLASHRADGCHGSADLGCVFS